MKRPPWLVPGAAAALLACGPRSGAEDGTPPNLILVSIDSLRADHLGCYGYGRETSPFLDRLAAQGVLFEDAVSTTSWTLPSHAAMFTGLGDSVHGLVDNGLALAQGHLTLAELLASRGYHTAGFFSGPYLHPTFGLGQGFEVYESCMTTTPAGASGEEVRRGARSHDAPSHADVTGPRTVEAVLAWAETRPRGDARPFFLFLHLWDVHYDYLAPPEYVALFDPGYGGDADGRLMSNPAIRAGMAARDLEHVLALYDAEIRFTDDCLARLFRGLEQRGLLEHTAVVVTADHGEEFFEHGHKGHNRTLFDEVLRVPLIVSWPGRFEAPRVVPDQVQVVDLMPTLAAWAGHRGPLAVQGRDLTPLLAGAKLPPRDALAELLLDGRELRALRGGGRKVFEATRGAPAVLFDLERDPGERRPIRPGSSGTAEEEEEERRARAQADLDAAVRRALAFRKALAESPAGAGGLESVRIDLSNELAEKLRSLGYLGDETGDETGDGSDEEGP